jgi:hypothetical protein
MGIFPVVGYHQWGVQVNYSLPPKADLTEAQILRFEEKLGGDWEDKLNLTFRDVYRLLPTPEESADAKTKQQNIAVYQRLVGTEAEGIPDPSDSTTAKEWWALLDDQEQAAWITLKKTTASRKPRAKEKRHERRHPKGEGDGGGGTKSHPHHEDDE